MITYIATLDETDNTGMFTISLVEEPAVETNWLKFNKDKFNFNIEDEEQRIITGVVMRADFPIYRNNAEYGEFYIKYDKETLRLMAERYFKNNQQNNINMAHNSENTTDKVNIYEMYIKNIERGINPKGFEDIEDGSLMASFKVNDDKIWEDIKQGKFKGFSLEGAFNLVKVEETTTDEEKEIMELIEKINNKLKERK